MDGLGQKKTNKNKNKYKTKTKTGRENKPTLFVHSTDSTRETNLGIRQGQKIGLPQHRQATSSKSRKLLFVVFLINVNKETKKLMK